MTEWKEQEIAPYAEVDLPGMGVVYHDGDEESYVRIRSDEGKDDEWLVFGETSGSWQFKPVHAARRDDVVAAWLKSWRDEYQSESAPGAVAHGAIDDLLNDYCDHADTGTPLGVAVAGPHGEDV
jgi:hypothetical protein